MTVCRYADKNITDYGESRQSNDHKERKSILQNTKSSPPVLNIGKLKDAFDQRDPAPAAESVYGDYFCDLIDHDQNGDHGQAKQNAPRSASAAFVLKTVLKIVLKIVLSFFV